MGRAYLDEVAWQSLPKPSCVKACKHQGPRAVTFALCAMVLVSEHVHPRSLSFSQQRRVCVLRDVHKESWEAIAGKVRNLQGRRPCWKVCRDAYQRLNSGRGRARYRYQNCGRTPVLTKPLKSWLIRQLVSRRRTTICTSTMLQRLLARERQVVVEASTIRRVLREAGYRWMPRMKKPRYTAEQKAERLAFAQSILALTPRQLTQQLHLAMDGVVLSVPPTDRPSREAYCHVGDTHVWRKPEEAGNPTLAGGDRYSKQVPQARLVPMWGGIAAGGFAVVLWHERRKVTSGEWAQDLVRALQSVNPGRTRGPWSVLCDNESFLRAGPSAAAHRRCNVSLWKLPAKSPDLNPVEKFWSWVRMRLRAMDLQDLTARRPVLGRMAFKQRVRRLVATARARQVAAACVRNLTKVAAEVVRRRGAPSRG